MDKLCGEGYNNELYSAEKEKIDFQILANFNQIIYLIVVYVPTPFLCG